MAFLFLQGGVIIISGILGWQRLAYGIFGGSWLLPACASPLFRRHLRLAMPSVHGLRLGGLPRSSHHGGAVGDSAPLSLGLSFPHTLYLQQLFVPRVPPFLGMRGCDATFWLAHVLRLVLRHLWVTVLLRTLLYSPAVSFLALRSVASSASSASLDPPATGKPLCFSSCIERIWSPNSSRFV